ncbi:MAG TPA: hypothetical protein VGL89_18105 [Candidatus Koribacter sp.]|jgi:hypothetical protein
MKARCFALLAVAWFAPLAVYAQAATPDNASSGHLLPDGYPVQLATGRMVSSEADQPGEIVEFLVKKAVMAGDMVVLPANTYVYGKIVASRMDNRQTGQSGMVEFRLESLKLANGQQIPLRNVRQVPNDANADVSPDALTNLVNSPYGPFAHFCNGPTTTVPKNSILTLYVAADVPISAPSAPASPSYGPGQIDSVAAHITNTNSGAKSLGEIAREQRQRGKISGGMVNIQ